MLASLAVGVSFIAAAAGTRLAFRQSVLQREYYAGLQAYQNGYLDEALEHLNHAVAEDPSAYQPRYVRGQLMVERGLYEDAVKDLQTAYHESPQELIAVWSGYACQRLRPDAAAENYYRRAILKHNTQRACVYNNLGDNYCKRGLFALALESLNKAVDLDPNCQLAYINRAITSANMVSSVEDPAPLIDRAILDVERATEFPANQALAHFWAGCIGAVHHEPEARDDLVLGHLRAALDHGFDHDKLMHECGLPAKYTELLKDYRPAGQKKAVLGPALICPPHEFPHLDG